MKRPVEAYLLDCACRSVLYLPELHTVMLQALLAEFVQAVDIYLSVMRDLDGDASDEVRCLTYQYLPFSCTMYMHVPCLSIKLKTNKKVRVMFCSCVMRQLPWWEPITVLGEQYAIFGMNCYNVVTNVISNRMEGFVPAVCTESTPNMAGASAQGGQGGGRPPKKIGTGAAPPLPKRKNTERRRKMTKVHCAPKKSYIISV